jgi:predicted ester cyclase
VQNAFPDIHITIKDMIAEDDRVVIRYIFTGTHQTEFWGIPPTGKSVEINGVWIHRPANHRIVEGRDWGLMDIYGMMKQPGVSNE